LSYWEIGLRTDALIEDRDALAFERVDFAVPEEPKSIRRLGRFQLLIVEEKLHTSKGEATPKGQEPSRTEPIKSQPEFVG
jgi:hypothetical protein